MGSCQCKKFCCNDQENTQLQAHEIATNDDFKSADVEQIESSLFIRIKTWQKESFSLFDYENQTQLKEQTFQVRQFVSIYEITDGGYLIKHNNEVQWFDKEIDWSRSIIKQDQVLFQIQKINGVFNIINSRMKIKCQEDEEPKYEQMTKYQGENKDFQQSENLEQVEADEFHQPNKSELIKNASMSQRTNTKLTEKGGKLWLVLRSAQQLVSRGAMKVREGDMLKMGRVKFKVREINLNPRQAVFTLSDSDSGVSSHSNAISCRMCYSSSYSKKNPLVNPCKCSGSIKYVHLECLKKWLKSKLQTRQSEFSIIYMWKNLECELCKFNYPPVFKSDEGFYDLIELSKPTNQPYILMEITQKRYEDMHDNANQVDETQQWNQCNGVYIVQFDQKQFLRIGRANETEVRVNDISVSRNHATLKLVNGSLYVVDNQSKFGTLLLLQSVQIPLIKELSGLELQTGRSVVQFYYGANGNHDQLSSEMFEQLIGGYDEFD